jgi:hypothetical protein
VGISLFVTGRISFAAIELLYEVAAKFMIDTHGVDALHW